jgi:uncharacterized protein with PIN domain
MSREEKKERMMARLEKAIDELLNWEEDHERPNFTQIEDIVLKMRKEIGEDMVEEMLVMQEGKTPVPGPACPECGQEMRLKGEYQRQIESRVGETNYERSYYYCPGCEEGIFPPG